MKKNKVIKCVCCDGKGFTEEYTHSYEDNEGYSYDVYKKNKCNYCNGKGVFSTDDLTYHITTNKIRNSIYKLKNNELKTWYTVYDKCKECNGTGILELENITDNKHIKAIKKKICKKCIGEGTVINHKKTNKVKHQLLKEEYDKLNYLNKIQKCTKLNYHATVRNDIQKLDAERLNVCLNCTNYENNLSWREICYNCHYHNIDEYNINFNPIDIRSKKWYNKINN